MSDTPAVAEQVTVEPQSEVEPQGEPVPSPGPKEEDMEAQLPPVVQDQLKGIDPQLLDPHGVMGRRNILPGVDGVPYRGPALNLKKDDQQPETGHEAHCEVLDLSNAEQLKRYTQIMQLIANGVAALGAEDRVYDPDVKSWRVFIRWWQMFTYVPKKR